MGDGGSAAPGAAGATGPSTQVLLTLTQQKRQLAAQAAELAALQEKHAALLSRWVRLGPGGRVCWGLISLVQGWGQADVNTL
jgi:hypothetical protein